MPRCKGVSPYTRKTIGGSGPGWREMAGGERDDGPGGLRPEKCFSPSSFISFVYLFFCLSVFKNRKRRDIETFSKIK